MSDTNDTKYDEETLAAMIGEHGGKKPKLTLNCTVPGKPMGMKTGIGGGRYVGINFGEQWNEQAFQAVKAISNRATENKPVKRAKHISRIVGDEDESYS